MKIYTKENNDSSIKLFWAVLAMNAATVRGTLSPLGKVQEQRPDGLYRRGCESYTNWTVFKALLGTASRDCLSHNYSIDF